MTQEERKARFVAKQRERDAAQRTAKGLPAYEPPKPTHRRTELKPVYGSQQWAETYRDDLGESPDF